MIHEHDYHAHDPLQSLKPYVAHVTFDATIEIPLDAHDDADAMNRSSGSHFLTDALNHFNWNAMEVNSYTIKHVEEDDTR